MMNDNSFPRGHPPWLPLFLGGLLALGGNVLAASGLPETARIRGAPREAPQPPAVGQPGVPGKSDSAASAFRKLDPTGKGYITKEDARTLKGFDPVFETVDSTHTGTLDYSQFVHAWKLYLAQRPLKPRQGGLASDQMLR